MVDVPGGAHGVVVYGMFVTYFGIGMFLLSPFFGYGDYVLLGVFIAVVGMLLLFYGLETGSDSGPIVANVEYDYLPTRLKCPFCGTLQPPSAKCISCGAPLPATKAEAKYSAAISDYMKDKAERQ
jgi:hypothetical protein